jgi:hypothetical protein
MATQEELRQKLLKDAESVLHPHVTIKAVEHNKLSLDSDAGPEPALAVAAGFARLPGWRIREVSSQGGETFTLWLAVEPDDNNT